MNSITEKTCIKCGITKDKTFFYSGNICKSCMVKKSQAWYNENKDRKKEYDQKRRKEKAGILSAIKKAYYAIHKKEINAKNKEYSKGHREKMNEYNRRWKSDNKEKVNELTRIRRARIKGNGGKLSKEEWREVLDKYGNKCLCCGSKERIEVDHVIPISVGGTNTKDNVQPLCRVCNARKNNQIIDYRSVNDCKYHAKDSQ